MALKVCLCICKKFTEVPNCLQFAQKKIMWMILVVQKIKQSNGAAAQIEIPGVWGKIRKIH